jgi:hypothetical protein
MKRAKKIARSAEDIHALIDVIESDERYRYPPADVVINAPLALIQVLMKAQVNALKWVLGGPHELQHKLPKKPKPRR